MFKIITIGVLGLGLMTPSTLSAVETNNMQLDMASLVDDLMNTSDTIKKKINLSGKQRMLTQRMTKLALLISLNIDSEKNKKSLLSFATAYNDALENFRGEENKAINVQLQVIEKAWKPFFKNVKLIVEGKDKNSEALSYLLKNNELLLKESNTLVLKYEEGNTSQNYMERAMVTIIDLAGRQRMLSQKMTKEKLLIVKGESKYNAKLKETVKLFDDSLTLLLKGDTKKKISKPSNKKIKKQLLKVSTLWKELKPLYKKEKTEPKELALIIQKNPILLKEINLMVKMAETETEY